jgi:hypothetical protein
MHGIIPPEAWRKIGFDPSKHTLYGGVLKWWSPKPIGCFNPYFKGTPRPYICNGLYAAT